MASFDTADLTDLSWWSIVPGSGVGVIAASQRDAAHAWLQQHGFRVSTHECRGGLAQLIPSLDAPLRWREKFGYELKPTNRNLDALNDGFRNLEVPDDGGLVLELVEPEIALAEDPRWFRGLLSIASRRSRYELAFSRRFFVLLVVTEGSPIIGDEYDHVAAPGPYWRPHRRPPQ